MGYQENLWGNCATIPDDSIGMNERLILGIVRDLGNDKLGVVLDPVAGLRCVRVERPSAERL
jgi:hypothetical protein